MDLKQRIENDFIYHAPKPGQPEKYEALRAKCKELAHLILDLVPAGREQSSALTRLEEVMFHSNAGVARN